MDQSRATGVLAEQNAPSCEQPALLLPVRIETRLVDGHLCIRVFPDQLFVNTHQERLTEEEFHAGDGLATLVNNSEWPSEELVKLARGEWNELARRYGTNRAAYILEWRRQNPTAAYATIPSDAMPHLSLLPDYFVFYIYKDGILAHPPVSGKPIPRELPLLPAKLPDDTGTALTDSRPEGMFDKESNWVRNFNDAIDAGLGVRLSLTAEPQSTPNILFSQIVVVGFKSDCNGAGCFAELVRNHHYTDGFEFIGYGTPTNNTREQVSGHSEDDRVMAAFEAEVLPTLSRLRNPGGELSPRVPETAIGRMANALGLGSSFEYLERIKGADAVTYSEFPKMLEALWPSTGDYFFSEYVGSNASAEARAMLLRHIQLYLRPRGGLPTIKIGKLPYGLLPVSRTGFSPSGNSFNWAFSELDHLPVEQRLTGEDWRAFDSSFVRALKVLFPRWQRRTLDSSVIPRIGGSKDIDEEILKILAMGPHSLSYRVRPVVDQKLIALLIHLLGEELFGKKSSFGKLTDPTTAQAIWAEEKERLTATTSSLLREMASESSSVVSRAMVQTTGPSVSVELPSILQAFAWGSGTPMNMPLVRDPDTPSDRPENYIPQLVEKAERGEILPIAGSNTLLYDLLRRSLTRTEWPAAMPQILAAIKVLRDFPILEFFNDNLTAADLTQVLRCVGDVKPESIPSASELAAALATARMHEPQGRFETVDSIKRVFVSPTVFSNIVSPLWSEFERKLDAGIRDLIDSLTCRLDAWFTSLAVRRLAGMRTAKNTGLVWGAYGYLEGGAVFGNPTIKGEPRPVSGYIHAPTVAHASTAALMRSAFETHRDEGDENPFALNLTSTRVRRAITLIEGVQQGQELGVLLGYQFERTLHVVGLDRVIDDFRLAFPFSVPDPEDIAEGAESIPARNVCDGRELAAQYSGAPEFKDFQNVKTGLLSALMELSSNERLKLREILADLNDTLDAVGDNLFFESVFQSQRNPDRAAAALDTSAGRTGQVRSESLATPVSGINLSHRVCVLMPLSETDKVLGPRATAEPRLNSWIESLLGPLYDIGCCVDWLANSTCTDKNTLRLDKLGISPLDFVLMCNAISDGTGNSEIEIRIRRYIRSQQSAKQDSTPRIDLSKAGGAKFSVSDAMEFGRAFLELLGNATPLTPAALAHSDTKLSDKSNGAYAGTMYDRAVTAKRALEEQLTNLKSTDPKNVLAALDMCAAYGIQEALIESADDPSISVRASQVLTIAEKRISKAGLLINQPKAGDKEQISLLTDAFKALFGESFVVLPEFEASQMPPFDGTTMKATPPASRVSLWFQQVAETHPRVRCLETLLMSASAWREMGSAEITRFGVAQLPINPKVGWQALSDKELDHAPRLSGCQSIVAIVPESLDTGSLAGFVIDEWTETIPLPKVSTGVSFEYNQPNCQAPHCFLLAVPGNFETKVWTHDHLAAIVRDTMELAKVRLVDLDAMPRVTGVFPALMFPISEKAPKKQVRPSGPGGQTKPGASPGVSQQGGGNAVSDAK